MLQTHRNLEKYLSMKVAICLYIMLSNTFDEVFEMLSGLQLPLQLFEPF